MRLRAAKATAKCSDPEIRVPVAAEFNAGYAVGSLNVHWNPEALVLKAVEYNADLAPKNQPAPIKNSGTNRVCFGNYLATENFTGTGTLFTLVFALAENAKPGTYAITFDKFDFLDKDISTLTASCTDGAVTLESGDDPGFLLGDVDGDGKFSVEDAQLTLKAYTVRIAGKDMNFDARQMKAANINGDDEISVDDAQFILIYYVNNTVAGNPVTWEALLEKAKKKS